jgi:hypothetical protein
MVPRFTRFRSGLNTENSDSALRRPPARAPPMRRMDVANEIWSSADEIRRLRAVSNFVGSPMFDDSCGGVVKAS